MQEKSSEKRVVYLLLHDHYYTKKIYCQQKNTIFSLRQKFTDYCIFVRMKKDFDYRASIILGMHDAIVSLTGLIAGLAMVFSDSTVIILSCIISSITASLSMGAANYLAVKATNREHAIYAALYTACAYMATCVLLILPFFVFMERTIALLSVAIIAIFIIYLFNRTFYTRRQFRRHFYEMLAICVSVSIIAFAIGEMAKYFFEQ